MCAHFARYFGFLIVCYAQDFSIRLETLLLHFYDTFVLNDVLNTIDYRVFVT